jgi:hypothetical protein
MIGEFWVTGRLWFLFEHRGRDTLLLWEDNSLYVKHPGIKVRLA